MQGPWEMSTCAWACIQHNLSEPAPVPPTPSKPQSPKPSSTETRGQFPSLAGEMLGTLLTQPHCATSA